MRADSKKGLLFGSFGSKTGVLGRKKNILFYAFSRFRGYLHLQVVVCQNLPANGRRHKKSRLKTYHRFLVLGRFW